VRVDNKAPAIASRSATIAAGPACRLSLSAMSCQHFIGGIMPISAVPLQETQRSLKFGLIERVEVF
jgi:hypothetical protein